MVEPIARRVMDETQKPSGRISPFEARRPRFLELSPLNILGQAMGLSTAHELGSQRPTIGRFLVEGLPEERLVTGNSDWIQNP